MRRSNEDRIIGLDVHLEQFCRSDPAANPSVLSGVDGKSNSRQVVEYNLFGTVNLLEYCKRAGAGFILLSTSRVYSIAALGEAADRGGRPRLNAFKAYRKNVIDHCRPLIAPHFNITVELPLKAIVRGFSWKVIPIRWRNRRTGSPKLRIKEMGSRYLFICLYIWLEKYLSRGDYRRDGN